MTPYMKMVADPCKCTLVPGIYGASEGILTKVKKTFFDGSNSACGFVLWSPDYHNSTYSIAGSPKGGNLFTWVGQNSSESISNSIDHPFGSGERFDATALTAHTEDDPAWQFTSEGLVQDARNISACIDMTYFGKMYEAEGEVTYVSNLPVSTVIDASNGYISVDRIFQHSNNTHRLGVETYENIWRPSDDDTFYNTTSNCIDVGVKTVGKSSIPDSTKAKGPTFFGFAFRGLTSSQQNNLRYNLTKIIEWRAQPSSGIAQTSVKATSTSRMPGVKVGLDTYWPDWNEHLASATNTGLNMLANAVLGGSVGGLKVEL